MTTADFTPYPRTSRYHDVAITFWIAPDGTAVPYLARRYIPQPDSFTTISEHVVSAGERPDTLANRYLGDPEQWWRIADASAVIDPRELTATPGRRVRITLPYGVPGGGNV